MKISKLTQSTRKADRAVITLSNGDIFSVHKDLILEKGLWAGKELTLEELENIKSGDMYYKLLDKAAAKIARRLCSRKEIQHYLTQYIFRNKLNADVQLLSKVIARLESAGMLNDVLFATQFITTHQNRKSIREIKNLLRLKGIDIELIDEVFPKENEEVELETIHKLIAKKYKTLMSRQYNKQKQREKILAFLVRKGFSFEKSVQAVDKFLNNQDGY